MELIDIVKDRADTIRDELSSCRFNRVDVEPYIAKFEALHIKYTEALKKGQMVQSHEIHRQISELILELYLPELHSRPVELNANKPLSKGKGYPVYAFDP